MALVFVFKFNCGLGNRYFWGCMFFLQHALSCYVYNRSLFQTNKNKKFLILKKFYFFEMIMFTYFHFEQYPT